MPPRKRTGAPISVSTKRARVVKPKAVKTEADDSSSDDKELKERFIQTLDDPNHAGGLSNSSLKEKFKDEYVRLVPIINELMQTSRLIMSKVGDELFYSLVAEEVASKFSGLDVSARMVYQLIEKAGNVGIWTKDVRNQTNIQQQTLNKIFKALESRRLIKPVKSVSSKKVYMLYNLTPAKELTGGPWYTELEFDHEFINEMRKFLMQCVKRLNDGKGVTLTEIRDKMAQAKVSKVELSLEEVQQLMQTLAYDHLIEDISVNAHGDVLYIAARRVTAMCDFQWWDALSPDFHFRKIRFEDGVELAPHEPHHHTA